MAVPSMGHDISLAHGKMEALRGLRGQLDRWHVPIILVTQRQKDYKFKPGLQSEF